MSKKQTCNQSGFLTIALVVLLFVVILTGIIGGILYLQKKKINSQPSQDQPLITEQPSTLPSIVLAKTLIKPENIVIEKVDVKPQIPSYNLPLQTKDISNYQEFSEKIKLSPKALSLLEKNGFAVIPTPENIGKQPDDFAAFYSDLKWKDLPVIITTDSLLHYYHIFFDTTLMKLERDLFYDDIWEMSKELLDDAVKQYNLIPEEKNTEDLKEAAKRNVAYLSVALEVLKPRENQVISDETMKEEYCLGMSDDYCQRMIGGVKRQYGDKTSFKYFSEEEFKKYDFEIPEFVKDLVQEEIELIEKHEKWEYSPIFIYQEDYSQHVPRGHYTKSEKLKNYFKALMWYGRMTTLVKGSPILSKGESMCTGSMDGIISEYDAKIQTLQASLIADKFSKSEDIQEKWMRMYAITSFFVGFSDDLGPLEYKTVLDDLLGKETTSQKIAEKYPEIKNALLDLSYNPKIYSGLGKCTLFMPCPPLSEEAIQNLKPQAKKLLEETKGFRLMGQRFTVDSWLFSEIVSPYSGEYNGRKLSLPTEKKPFTFLWNDEYSEPQKNRPFTWTKTDVAACPPPAAREVRGFPRGLDVLALFGSERAKEILEESGDAEYSDYEKKFLELKSEIDSLPKNDWFQNVYWNWLYVLKFLGGEYSEGYPTFMQTQAWQDKELNTALASWAELRHDTILYVKQSYTMAEMGGAPAPKVVGYVEPAPEFYARLLALTKMTNNGLGELVPQEELEKLKIGPALDNFSEILDKLLEISKKELENKSLSDEEYGFIKRFGKTSENLIKLVSGDGVDPKALKTVLIADVHTDGNTEMVLEEGTGYLKTLVAAYKLPEGHILIGVGPVFSYYEFKQPMAKRLTDEKWREILNSENHPSIPEWTKSFSE
jgi:hypothetical protein